MGFTQSFSLFFIKCAGVLRIVIVRVVLSVFISVVRGMLDVAKERSYLKWKFSVIVILTIN